MCEFYLSKNWKSRKIEKSLKLDKTKEIIENIKGVTQVFEQFEWDYAPSILKYKPDFMVHGTDWLIGPLAPYRELAIKALESYGGKLIEVEYTKDVSSTSLTLNQKIKFFFKFFFFKKTYF